MTLDLSQHGRARMNLPHGFVGLDVTADRLTLTVRRQHSTLNDESAPARAHRRSGGDVLCLSSSGSEACAQAIDGGLDMAVEHVTGGRVVWCADNARGPSIVQAARFGVPNHGDLTRIDWATVEPVDMITAGYPCQPFSAAGRKRGTADERHLWPHVAAAIRNLRPRLVVLENVANHRRIGFGDVLGDLAALGFDADWTSIRASDVGACHGRDRVFVVAYASDATRDGRREGQPESARPQHGSPTPDRLQAAADTGGEELPRWAGLRQDDQTGLWGTRPSDSRDDRGFPWGDYTPAINRWAAILGRRPAYPVLKGPGGGRQVSPRFVEWMMGLAPGWVTDVQGLNRVEKLELLGNGVVPQQAEAALRELLSAACEVAA